MVMVATVESSIMLILSTPGRTLTVTTSSGESLKEFLRSLAPVTNADSRTNTVPADLNSPRDNSQGISAHTRAPQFIFASNHTTFMDAPLLAPMIGRASSTSSSISWLSDNESWPFTAASASLLFRTPLLGTAISLLCGLPLQPKWIKVRGF